MASPSRSLLVKRLIYLLSFVALALAAAWLGQRAVNRDLTAAEVTLALVVLVAFLARWVVVQRRRQRQKVEEMRDSALW